MSNSSREAGVLFLTFVVCLLALTLEVSLRRLLPVSPLVPDFVTILVVDLAFKHRGIPALMTAFAMGLATDAVAGSRVGSNAFTTTLVFMLAAEFVRQVRHTEEPIEVAGVFVGVVLRTFGGAILNGSPEAVLMQAASLLWWALENAVATALVTIPVLSAVRRYVYLPNAEPPRRT